MLLLTVNWPVCHCVNPHLGPKARFLVPLGSCRFVDVGSPFWQEDRSTLPVQSFLDSSPTSHDRILLSQIQDSPNLDGQVPIFIHQEYGGPVICSGTEFPFVGSNNFLSYDGGIQTHFHRGVELVMDLLYVLITDCTENTAVPSIGPTVPALLHIHPVSCRGINHAIAKQQLALFSYSSLVPALISQRVWVWFCPTLWEIGYFQPFCHKEFSDFHFKIIRCIIWN
jgi:hypothetical protein